MESVSVDIESLDQRLSVMTYRFEYIARNSFKSHIDDVQEQIASADGGKRSLENSIQEIKWTMNSTSGVGMGCLAAFLAWVFTSIAVAVFLEVLKPMGISNLGPLGILVNFVFAIIAFAIGNHLWRGHKNSQSQKQLDDNIRSIEECAKSLPPLAKLAEDWAQAIRAFVEWQANLSVLPKQASDRDGTFSVTFISYDREVDKTINAIREITGCEMREAVDLLFQPNKLIVNGLNVRNAEVIRKRFADVGATVRIEEN